LFHARLVQAIGFNILSWLGSSGEALRSTTNSFDGKSQTLIPVSVPITNQYFFGANSTQLIGESTSVYPRYFPSTKFQIIARPSLPPDAK
jgi:hypothetical protein